MNIPNLHRIADCIAPRLRRPVPNDWTETTAAGPPMWTHPSGLRVAATSDKLEDGSWWLHVSVSRADKLPSWDDLKFAKDAFIGRNYEAVQVLPKDTEFVNCMPFCLHLWSQH